MVVCIAHGRVNGPLMEKIQALARVAERMGCRTIVPDFTDSLNPDLRVKKLLNTLALSTKPLVLAGSSMGGYVVTVASEILRPAGLFLLAPTFNRPGYAQQTPSPYAEQTLIVHGWQDDVVPVEHSIQYAREYGTDLHLVSAGHSLNEKIDVVVTLFDTFLKNILASSETLS